MSSTMRHVTNVTSGVASLVRGIGRFAVLVVGVQLGSAAAFAATFLVVGVVWAAAVFVGAWLAILVGVGGLLVFAHRTRNAPPPEGF